MYTKIKECQSKQKRTKIKLWLTDSFNYTKESNHSRTFKSFNFENFKSWKKQIKDWMISTIKKYWVKIGLFRKRRHKKEHLIVAYMFRIDTNK